MIAILDYIQDVLSGLNVREYNYIDADAVARAEVERETENWLNRDDRFDSRVIPFTVTVYDDGLDYDMDGNSYFDDYPSDVAHSHHRTRKGAEQEAAWLEHQGTPTWRIRIVEDYPTYAWELKYHPIRD